MLAIAHSLLNPFLAVGHSEINCLGVEFVTVQPLSGQTCSEYLTEFISNSGGYISNPTATDSCQYCPARTTDQFLDAQFNVKFSDRWLSFGLLWVYIAFNVSQARADECRYYPY
jgi:ATP-binding cassette, subfamily G (WHITE), member 2, PDR